MQNIKTKPFILILSGVILGLFTSLSGIGNFILSAITGKYTYLWTIQRWLDITNVIKFIYSDSLLIPISSIIGFILCIALIFLLVEISKQFNKKIFIASTLLGFVGIILGLGLGGILVMIGGIHGLVYKS
ncbi:MAG: hypothetical protein FJY91_01580 [Candidatus Harrisonbacteria bacterium]|nr:hypothetical protein [Candidatus Harrisonbacteria bacterium]